MSCLQVDEPSGPVFHWVLDSDHFCSLFSAAVFRQPVTKTRGWRSFCSSMLHSSEDQRLIFWKITRCAECPPWGS
ncbi:hypothetical protein ATANTOWER_012784 [Ataeniobius toweri]|uniref:Uncharacterized protein n=1 Tax=Ataeniobius toweri TaxID=208326 RepID=A0ABU7BK67_9TELE|nr:hypothetical protein [Ataeniobius toweri]